MRKALLLMSAAMIAAPLFTRPGHAAAAPDARFHQDRFAIGFWVDPPGGDGMEQAYERIAQANFTLVIGGFGGKGKAFVDRQMKLCRDNDLNVIVSTKALTAEQYPTDATCWGYMLKDEPGKKDFASLAKRVAQLRQSRPGKLGYINLFPDYAKPNLLGFSTYSQYIHNFIKTVHPDMLAMDHYPRFKPGGNARELFCKNVAVMRQTSLDNHIPFWNFISSMPVLDRVDPTAAQMRWQVYTSLAYGAKGILYFCYYTPVRAKSNKGGALIAGDGRPTRHYYEAKRINRGIKNLGPVLMKLTSTGVYRLSPGTHDIRQIAGSAANRESGSDLPVSYIEETRPSHLDADVLIGAFRFADGRRAVLINNYRFAFTAWLTVAFDADARQVLEVNQRTGEIAPVIDDSPRKQGLQISLDAGGGRLFILPATAGK